MGSAERPMAAGVVEGVVCGGVGGHVPFARREVRGVEGVGVTCRAGETGSNPGGAAPEFSHVGIVPGGAAGRRVFSRLSRFPQPFHTGIVPYSPRFSLIGSQDLQDKSLPNLSSPFASRAAWRPDFLSGLYPGDENDTQKGLAREGVHSTRRERHTPPRLYFLSRRQIGRRNENTGETGDPRGNPPTSYIVRHDSDMRKSGMNSAVNRTRFAYMGG
ncbi:hypothetical protein PR048_031189 [Dryococelus australis]|uniref:Uncharacterized protein n=1 Tax=Dryococelus australis TaxID=614101 RepID=A0ABQ9G7N9_9NEOP|nr:hypothetical protein PR048_031189 [Dryococelus australis]